MLDLPKGHTLKIECFQTGFYVMVVPVTIAGGKKEVEQGMFFMSPEK